MTDEAKKFFFVEAKTGCTCCRSENTLHGPYTTKDGAICVAKAMYETQYISSQYSANGEYVLYSAEYEELPDGRIIIGRLVFRENEGGTLGHPDILLPHLNLKQERGCMTKWFLEE